MARFAVGQMVETREPIIEVDPGMEPGRHRFQLVVVNEANVRSAPATAVIDIERGVEPPRGLAPLSLQVAAPAIAPAAAPEKRAAKPRKKTTKPGPKKK